MKINNQNNNHSILFLVLGETEQEQDLASGILLDTEICACACTNMNMAEIAVAAAVHQPSNVNMIVIATPENGPTMKKALSLAKRAKDCGILSVIATQSYGRTPTQYLAAESLTLEQVRSCVDCILFTPVYGNEIPSLNDINEQFYFDVQAFLRFMSTMLEGNDFIYLDFDDISSILKENGFAYMGIGHVKGADIQERTAHMATMKILPDDILKASKGTIMHVLGSENINLDDVEAAADRVQSNLNSDAAMIFCAGFCSQLHHEICIDVLTTGIVS